jgi:hypothetical protein
MALFPNLDIEEKVQLNDKTRLSGVRSFVTKDADPITTMTIKAGSDGSEISAFDAKESGRYLDWQFSTFNLDVDSTNNKIDFKEGSTSYAATISTNTYTLSSLCTEIKTQMEAAGAYTYTVTTSDNKITIAATGTFSLLPSTGTNYLTSLLPTIGFSPRLGYGDTDYGSKTTVTGRKIRHLTKAITITIGDGTTTANKTEYIEVYSKDGDALFSSDGDLKAHKEDIMNYLRPGRNSYLNFHRRAQDLIISTLDREGFVDVYGVPYSIDAFVNLEEFRQWSTFMTLRLIFEDRSNAIDDVFDRWAKNYGAQESQAKSRAILRIDIDGDGSTEIGEGIGFKSSRCVRV